MLLLIQVVCLLTVTTQTVRSAYVPQTVFWPSDPFLDAHSDSVYENTFDTSAEVTTTLGPFRSRITQQQNVAEDGGDPVLTDQIKPDEKIQDPLTFAATELLNSAEITKEQEQDNSEFSGTEQQNSGETGNEPASLDLSGSVEAVPVVQITKSEAQQQNGAEVSGIQQQNSAETDVSPTTMDPFNSGEILQEVVKVKSAAQQHNSAEVAGTQQQNSAEVTGTQQQNSAEVTGTQQQNSAEISGTQQQQNSAEVGIEPATLDPFNSGEVTPKPLRKNPPTVEKKKISENNKNEEGGTGNLVGTQTLYPQSTNGERVQEGGSASSSQPGNTGTVETTPGTQPFFPGITNVKEEPNEESNVANSVNSAVGINPETTNVERIQEEKNSNSAQADNTGTVNTAPGTQPFFPGITNVKEEPQEEFNAADPLNAAVGFNSEIANDVRVQEEEGSSLSQLDYTGTVNTAPGTQPSFPGITNVKEEPQEESSGPDSNNAGLSVSGEASKKTNVEEVQEADGVEPAKPENTGVVDTLANSQTSENTNVKNEQVNSNAPNAGTIKAGDISKIAGLEPFVPSEPGQVTKIAGLEPISFEPSQPDSVPNSLRDALAQVGVTSTFEDPLVEQAKTYFISIWNLEANSFGAPYLEVTDVWPEIGMVYMPTINQMSSRIQNSKPVKEAAERLKSIWEERNPDKPSFSADGSNVFGALTDYISSWNTRDQNTKEESVLYSNQNPVVSPTFPVNNPAVTLDFDVNSDESLERLYYEPLPLYRLYRR